MTAEAATAESRRTESVAAERRSGVGRAGRGVRHVRAAVVRPCVDVERGDRRDGAVSAVAPEPERALRRRADCAESRRAESAAAGRRIDVGQPPGRGVCHMRAAVVRPCVDAALGDRRDGAASVVPEPVRAIRRRAARVVTAEGATTENRRAESVAAER